MRAPRQLSALKVYQGETLVDRMNLLFPAINKTVGFRAFPPGFHSASESFELALSVRDIVVSDILVTNYIDT